jgi:hypothetical protein
MTPALPPVQNPTIGTPSHVRDTPYQVTITVSVGWHYNPYISRTVWVEWGGPGGQLFTMQPVGNIYTKTLTGLGPSEAYDYRIKATEVYFDPQADANREGTSYTAIYSVAAWPAPNVSGWTFRKSHVLIGEPGAGIGYQVRINATYVTAEEDGWYRDHDNTVYMDRICREDFADIRFLTSDCQAELPYWREKYILGKWAIFWVKMYEDLDEDVSFWIYYGKDNAATTTDGPATFIFFDDFESGNLNQWDAINSWTAQTSVVHSPGNWAAYGPVGGGSLVHDCSQHEGDISYGIKLHAWLRSHDDDKNYAVRIDTNDGTGYDFIPHSRYVQWYDGAQYHRWGQNDAWTRDTWYEAELGIDPLSDTTWAWLNGKPMGQISLPSIGGSPSTIESLIHAPHSHYAYDDLYIDDYYIRKWIPNEPAHGRWSYREALITEIFYEDCGDINAWEFKSSYSDWAYAIDEPSSNTVMDYSGGNQYFFPRAVSAGSGWEGQAIATRLTSSFKPELKFMTRYLEEFYVKLECDAGVSEMGRLSVYLYDDSYEPKPIVGVEISDESSSSNMTTIDIVYWDRYLTQTKFTLEDSIQSWWDGEIKIWWTESGLLVDNLLDPAPPELAIPRSKADPERHIGRIVIQGARHEGDALSVLRVHELRLTRNLGYQDDSVILSKALEYRSGPMALPIQRPGPTNEVQLFPQDNDGKITFLGSIPTLMDTASLYLDIRSIWLEDPSSVPGIRVWVNDLQLQTQDLPSEPFNGGTVSSINFLFAWEIPVVLGPIEITIDVKGGDFSNNDIIAFRGIWLYFIDELLIINQVPLSQQFPSTRDIEYLVPMGPDTILDLDWYGTEPLRVWVDNSLKGTLNSPGYISLGDFARESIHTLRIEYLGDPTAASLLDMHTHHHWMSIEIDWIEGYYPSLVNFEGAFGFEWIWQIYTHGRIDCIVSPTGLPPYDTDGMEISYSQIEVQHLADTYYDNHDSKSHFWALYVPLLTVDYYGQTVMPEGYSTYRDSSNGWDRYPYTAVAVLLKDPLHIESVTQHEWGHVAHSHEGYGPLSGVPEYTKKGEACQRVTCVYNDFHLLAPIGVEICEFHWRQTWQNVPGYWKNPYHWTYDWWLM